MRILVLSRRRSLYTSRRLVEAAKGLGHEARVVNPLSCFVDCGSEDPAVLHGPTGLPLDGIDVVVPRIGASITDYGLAVVSQFESAGVPILNAASAIARARDKLASLQHLSREGLPVPRTVLARNPGQIAGALRRVGGPPVVLKLLRGSQGVGVMLAETVEALEAITHTVWSLGENIVLQEFIGESRGRDVRIFVLGGRVVAAMRRSASLGDFRSNLHRGGVGRSLDLPGEYARLAVDAASILELDVAGVDLLESRTGPKVLEVNPSPGFEGLERVTGVDVAGAIVRHAVRLAEDRIPRRRTG